MQTALFFAASLALALAQSDKPLVTLDRNPAALDWKTWLKGSEAAGTRGLNAPPRRITTKSLFIAPQRENLPMCAEGYRPDEMGRCVKVVRVDENAHNNFLLDKLNSQFGSQLPDNGDFSYDYSEDPSDVSSGPFQLNIPISLQASTDTNPPHGDINNVTAVNVPQATDAHQVDKKDVMQADQSVRNETLIQQLESLKAESLVVSVVNSSFGLKDGNETKDKLAQDSTATNSDNLDSNENIREMVNLDTNFIENKNTERNLTSVDKLTENKNDSLVIDILPRINGTGISFFNDTPSHEDRNVATADVLDEHLKKNETSSEEITQSPTLQNLPHPEIDYSDLGEALKIISRFAEVSTDEMFSDEYRSGQTNSEEDLNPLGTRTKLQHRKKQSSRVAPIHSRESPDLPTYEIPPNQLRGQTTFRFPNGVSASSNLRGNLDVYNWPNLRPEPPMDLRNIMNFWPQPNQYSNLNGQHVNPTRHRHSYLYPALSHPGGERIRQAAPINYRWPRQSLAQHPAPPADLYNILGIRHWLRNREGGDER